MKILLTCACISVFIIMAAVPFFVSSPGLWVLEGAAFIAEISLAVLYRMVVVPMAVLKSGVSLLREQAFNNRLAKVGQKGADNIGAVFNSMMDRLKNERLRVMEQNHFLEMLIGASPMGILIFDYEGHIKSANPAAKIFLGRTKIEGLGLSELEGSLSRAMARMKNGETKTVRLNDTHIYRCSRLSFLDSGFNRPFMLIESLSEEVRSAEKNAYEKIIRTFAHEIRNTTAGSMTVLGVLKSISADPELVEAISSCEDRWKSLSTFISAYADVAKLPEPDLKPLDLNMFVNSLHSFLESLASGRSILIKMELCANPPVVRGDSVQLEQAIVNIVKNSIESIGTEGSVTIRTGACPDTLEIVDSGAGISEDVSRNLFTPFFTTKPGGQGIGLMFVSEILHNHGCGFRLFTSDQDGLTHFTVSFPEYRQETDQEQRRHSVISGHAAAD